MGDLQYMKTQLPGEAHKMDQAERQERKDKAEKLRKQAKRLTAGDNVEMTITPTSDMH